MKEVTCPNCQKAFKIDKAGYADILKQVRDTEFEEQLHGRLELAEREKENAVELAKNQVSNEMQKDSSAKDMKIQKLKAEIGTAEMDKKLAVTEAVRTVNDKDR